MYITLVLIFITVVISYKGMKDSLFMDKYMFSVEKINLRKEYIRFVSSGFLHINWLHLIVNMFVLWAFGSGLEASIGVFPLLLIYFTSMVGGNFLALQIHKHHRGYSSVGASGAVAGLVFASIALVAGFRIFFLPAWMFGVAYVIYTLYAIRAQRTDVGHAAHLGGALIGMLVAVLLYPQVLTNRWLPILGILLPGLALLLIMIYKPNLIVINKKTQRRQLTLEDKYNFSKKNDQEEVDRILEKINKKGMSSLTGKERELLDKYSRS